LVECALCGERGVEVDLTTSQRPDIALFSESQGRAVVSISSNNLDAVLTAAEKYVNGIGMVHERSLMKEDCGVFGVVLDNPEASVYIYYGLQALQHRGEESAGIAVYDGSEAHVQKGMGLVSEVFDRTKIKSLKGSVGIGHVRYSTTGAPSLFNAQPLVAHLRGHSIAVAHNGNLINAEQLRDSLEKEGRIFQTTSDTEIIMHLIAKNLHKGFEKLLEVMKVIKGSYALLVLFDHTLAGVRDPNGIRPL